MNISRAGCILLLCTLPSLAAAESISYTANISTTAVGSNTSVSLSQFDPSLGLLVSVDLELIANTSNGSILFDNEGGAASSVTLGIGSDITATGPDALAIVAVPMQLDSGTVDADDASDGSGDFMGSDSFMVTIPFGTDSDTGTATNLTPYIGTGTFPVSIASVVETLLSTSGGFGPIDPMPGLYDGTVNVTYHYTPEPTTLALLGGGALVLLRRRFR